jgi:hypothetical protein
MTMPIIPECFVPQYSAQKMWNVPVFVASNHITRKRFEERPPSAARTQAMNHIFDAIAFSGRPTERATYDLALAGRVLNTSTGGRLHRFGAFDGTRLIRKKTRAGDEDDDEDDRRDDPGHLELPAAPAPARARCRTAAVLDGEVEDDDPDQSETTPVIATRPR